MSILPREGRKAEPTAPIYDRPPRLVGITARLHLRCRGLLRGQKAVLGGVERGARLPDVLQLEDRLDFFGTLGRLDQDETQDLPARQGYLRMVCDLGQGGEH